MITAAFIRRKPDRALIGFSVSGHAEYDEPGLDIVCAGVSSAVMLTANIITEGFGVPAKVNEANGQIEVLLPPDCKTLHAIAVVAALKAHLEAIAQDYPEAIAVTERRFEEN